MIHMVNNIEHRDDPYLKAFLYERFLPSSGIINFSFYMNCIRFFLLLAVALELFVYRRKTFQFVKTFFCIFRKSTNYLSDSSNMLFVEH